MFRNRGIDYKFPRSTGGKFYSARIDEGMSGITINWGPEYVPPVVPELMAELWSWNKTNINEFHSGSVILIGNVTGSVTGSYVSGTIFGGRRSVPYISYNFSTNFQTPRSGGFAVIPINPGFPLPSRYEVQLSYRIFSSDGDKMVTGLYFNANQLTSSTTNFHASALIVTTEEAAARPKTLNITTGAVGRARPAGGSVVDARATTPVKLRFLIETLESTGSASGPVWRVQALDSSIRSIPTSLLSSYPNETSGSNTTWINAGNLDRFGILIGRLASGSNNSTDRFEIQEILIKRHPQDF